MVRGRISSPVFVRFSPGVTKDQYFMMGAGRSARSFSLILGQFHQQMGANGSTLREKKVPRREVLASCPPARSQMAARQGWSGGRGSPDALRLAMTALMTRGAIFLHTPACRDFSLPAIMDSPYSILPVTANVADDPIHIDVCNLPVMGDYVTVIDSNNLPMIVPVNCR